MIDSETGLPYSFAPDASSTAATAGGISPLLLALMQQQGGPGMQQLIAQYLMSGGAALTQPAPLAAVADNQLQQPAVPLGYGASQPDPLTPQQRAFMGYGGPGQPVDWYAAMGLPGGAQGTTQPMYQPQTPQQSYTPQDFVTQWQQMFGSK